VIKLFLIILLQILSSCATIQKDIYFKSSGSKLGKVSTNGATPGSTITLEGPSTPNGSSSTYISISNKSNGVYLFGIIVPIIPVFFIGNSQFELDPTEKLTVHCNTWFFMKKTDGKQWYDHDKPCKSLQIIANGQRFNPITSDVHGSFVFNIKAANLKKLLISGVVIDNGKGSQFSFNENFEMLLESKVHYHIPNVAP